MIEPGLRERKRYIVFETRKKKTFSEVKSKIYKAAIAFLGEKGLGETGLIFLKEHWIGQKGIIRASHKKVDELKFILGLTSELKAKTIKTTGSLKKAKKRINGE